MTDETAHDEASGDDTLTGAAGADTFVFDSNHGNDVVTDFTNGEDVIDLSAFSTISDFSDLTVTSNEDGVTIDLTAHGGGTILLQGFNIEDLGAEDFQFRAGQLLVGDDGDNTLTGDTGNDNLFGGEGDDTLEGHGGGDGLFGEEGDDELYGGEGVDFIAGGRGDDTLHGGEGNDDLFGGEGDDALHGGEGDDNLFGGGHSFLAGGHFDADSGNDTLYGGEGQDLLVGGKGDDTLHGGADEDTFVFTADHGNDTVMDFADGEDLIDLAQLSGIAGFDDVTITADGNDAVIDLTAHGGGTIRLEDFDVADLDAEDFVFAEPTVDPGAGIDGM